MKRNLFITIVTTLTLLLFSSCNSNKKENLNSITVSGIGTAIAAPDLAQININFSHTAPTTTEAKRKAEVTMEKILSILKAENIENKDIQTQYLNYRTEYEYRNGYRVKLGQRAEQRISINVNNLIEAPERLSSILDKVVAIDKVEVNYINFSIEDKSSLYKKSRELAYQKASEKAQEYAKLCGRKLGRVLTLSEYISNDVARAQNVRGINNYAKEEAVSVYMDAAHIPTGEQNVTTEISVVFSLD